MGKIGPPYLLSELGNLSCLLYFSKHCLVGNIQEKLKLINSSVILSSEESPRLINAITLHLGVYFER